MESNSLFAASRRCAHEAPNPCAPGRRRAAAAWLALTLVLASAGAAQAQNTEAVSNIARTEVRVPAAVPRAAVGSLMRAPRARVAGPDAPKPRLTCSFVCSAYVPRQVTARVVFPEGMAASAQVRLDVATGADALRQGDFGSVPLRAVPEARVQPGARMDSRQLRMRVEPVYFDKVRDHHVVPRDPALQPQRLAQFQREAPAATPAQAPADLREALERDARSGAIEQMRVLAQGAEQHRGTLQRSVIIEGMQPGLAYEIRLVQDTGAEAENLDQSLCPVPVCPADYVDR